MRLYWNGEDIEWRGDGGEITLSEVLRQWDMQDAVAEMPMDTGPDSIDGWEYVDPDVKRELLKQRDELNEQLRMERIRERWTVR